MLSYPDIVRRHVARLARAYRVSTEPDLSVVLVENFPLPPGWEPRVCPVLLNLPVDYPLTPVGLSTASAIELPFALRFRGSRVRDFHEHKSREGWCWFCYLEMSWNPSRDDLFTILERLQLDLSHPEVA